MEYENTFGLVVFNEDKKSVNVRKMKQNESSVLILN